MKVISKIMAGFMAANMFLGTTIVANAGTANNSLSASKKVYSRYRAVQSGVSQGGAILGLKELGSKLSQKDKILFLSAMNEIGNLPGLEMVEGGLVIHVGRRTLFVEFVDATEGRFRVGGYDLVLDSESSFASVYSRLENAASSIQFGERERSFLDQAFSAIFVEDAQAFGVVGWIVAAVVTVVLGMVIYNSGKKKGRREARYTQHHGQGHAGHSHHGGSHGGGQPDDSEETLVDDAEGDSYIASTDDVSVDSGSSDLNSDDEPVIEEVAI